MASPSAKKSRRPPPGQPPPETTEDMIRDIWKRVVRIETRQGRQLEHQGLDSQGNPIPPPKPTTGETP